ncbi:MAG: hypothetical protein AB7G28_03195 [Pirellulales bacterium]
MSTSDEGGTFTAIDEQPQERLAAEAAAGTVFATRAGTVCGTAFARCQIVQK